MNRIDRVAKELGLPSTGQDWGIEHADPSRLDEFLAFAEQLEPENPWEFEAIAELVFQSAEEALGEETRGEAIRQRLVHFAVTNGHLFPNTLAYWRSLSRQEWLIPQLLEEASLQR